MPKKVYKQKCFSVKTKNSNWDKMGLRIKNFKKWHLKRGGGAWTVCRFKGRGAWQERGWGKGRVFERVGLIPQCALWARKKKKT